MADQMVLKTQQWLNNTYGEDSRFNRVTEDGITGWETINGLTRALQIELGIQSTADNFGTGTKNAFNERFPSGIFQQESGATEKSNIYSIIQGALWCKGYSVNAYDITQNFYGGTGRAITNLKMDMGLEDISSTVTLNVMMALLSMKQFKLLRQYYGQVKIRLIQQELNRKYENYVGIIPCDGLYNREMNEALIKVLQAIEGYSVSEATGNFGSGTKSRLPLLPNDGSLSNTVEQEAIKLVRYALCCNDYININIYPKRWDPYLVDVIKEFQRDMGLPINGNCDVNTWMALLLSKGNTDRNCTACDTRFEMTADRLEYLVNNGYSVVGRYLTGGDFKQIREGELQRILDAGLSFFPIFQESSTNVSYFTEERAIEDAINAKNAAVNFKIPRRSIIYFAVDLDATDSQISNYVLPYFKKLHEYMKNELEEYYQIGVYGTRNVCTRVCGNGYAVTSFVSDMSVGYSGNMGFKIPDNWNIDQFHEFQVTTSSGTWDLDKDMYSGKFAVVNKLDEVNPNKTVYDKLNELFNYATAYAESKNLTLSNREKNKLVLEYLRYFNYNNELWMLIATPADGDFVKFVHERANSDVYSENIHIYKEGYGNMKIPHLAATLDALLYNFILFDNEANDLAGWAGDLLQFGYTFTSKIGDRTFTEQNIYDLIGGTNNELANSLMGCVDEIINAEKTGFGLEDFELDIDAIGLFEDVNNGVPIHTAFYNYYTGSKYNERISTFLVSTIGSYSSKSDAENKLIELAKKYTLLQTLTSRVFVFSKGYDKEMIGNVLAEQFAKKIVDLL